MAARSGTGTPITTTATTLVKTGPGVLLALVFNKPVATGVVTIYDALTATGTPKAIVTVPASPQPFRLEYGLDFDTGLCIVTSVAAQDITAVWR